MHNHYQTLKELHEEQTTPLLLLNCWDIHSATELDRQGIEVIATSSFAVADNLGYGDGQQLPFENVLSFATQLVQACSKPVTYDIEGFYTNDVSQLYKNAILLIKTGISGLNFEDQKFETPTPEIWSIPDQVKRIQTIKAAADSLNTSIFINARTDLFLQNTQHTDALIREALIRTDAYKQAGADCIFVPGLTDLTLIKNFSKNATLPVNIMLNDALPTEVDWKALGVRRVSYGPHLYLEMANNLKVNIQEKRKAWF